MPIRRSPNDARHPSPQGGRDHPEQVVAINRNDWSQSIGTPGRDHPVRALLDEFGNVTGIIASKLDVIRLSRITDDVAQSGNFAIKAKAVPVRFESVGFSEG